MKYSYGYEKESSEIEETERGFCRLKWVLWASKMLDNLFFLAETLTAFCLFCPATHGPGYYLPLLPDPPCSNARFSIWNLTQVYEDHSVIESYEIFLAWESLEKLPPLHNSTRQYLESSHHIKPIIQRILAIQKYTSIIKVRCFRFP